MKERLTGAIILVALIVLLVPELLTGPLRPKSAPDASPTSSSAMAARAVAAAHAEPPLRSYTLTLSGQPPVTGAAATSAAQAAAQPAEGAADGSPESAATQGPAPSHALLRDPARQPSTASVPQASAAHAARAAESSLQDAKLPAHSDMREGHFAVSTGGWVVQLGSFASRQNAERLAHALEGKGFRTSVSPARAHARVLWRVRAGPARDRTAAQRLAARLRALGHRGELLPAK